MRVLHVYGGNLYGGVERLLVSLARHAGYGAELESEFGLCYRGRLWRELEEAGARVVDLGGEGGGVRVSRPWQVRQARRRLGAYLAGADCGAVMCHAWWSYAIFGPAARKRDVPVGLWAHNTFGGGGWLERWAGRHTPDLLVTHGAYMAATLGRMFPGTTAHVLHAPVAGAPAASAAMEQEQRRALRRKLDTPEDAVAILQASRLEEWKGQRLHLAALARLRDRPEWVCWMAGGVQRPEERRYCQELQELAQTYGIADRMRWLGEREDVEALMAAADIFCQPNSGAEPFGLVFVEALAAGLPVVATALGGALEIVTPDCGILTEPRAEAVESALRGLIANAEERRRRAAGSRERARELCDPERQMRSWRQLLQTLVPGAAAAGAGIGGTR